MCASISEWSTDPLKQKNQEDYILRFRALEFTSGAPDHVH